MPELINTADLQTPIEALEDNLDFFKGFYNDERFEDMENAKKLIERYEKAISILTEVQNEY
ncbi:hypothetical protein [Streptococcus dysgalactiae]|uniref:hypothetical protein n=1 Tax=Streptococcus dysgalactiae TaxID=1334 RepID=UPI000617B12A|nr:hypothetical protein [Streptococcus dysgalactiae]KKC23180.1 hypothetical protein WH79_02860 [Streptococcus dysgalactiae subsp. equisimilis]QBX23912.1 hypothetical protein Javan166_0041 [Streptococcus phage Javan166]